MAKPVQAREGREPYWRQVVDRWKQGVLAVPAFCRREGLNQATFCHWRWELKRRDQAKPAFLPVRVIADANPGRVDVAGDGAEDARVVGVGCLA